MISTTITRALLLFGLAAGLPGPTAAQFDPEHNHLECYGIKAPRGQKFLRRVVDVETQFGTQRQVEVMKPVLLCAPARKTGGGSDPIDRSPLPHFTCYRVRTQFLDRAEQLADQFGSGTFSVQSAKLLCTPTVKDTGSPPTTTLATSTTTTTTTTPTTTSGPAPTTTTSTTGPTITVPTITIPLPTTTTAAAATTTTTTSSTTTTTAGGGGCGGTQLRFSTTAGTTQCGGNPFSPFNPPPVAPFSGAIYSDTTCTTKINDLGAGCLHIGGGNNNQTPPSATPEGGLTIYDVASCSGNTLTLAPHPLAAENNPKTCSQGSLPTRHCAKDATVSCSVDGDCTTTGLGPFCVNDARCYFGPPVPIPALGTEACVLNVIDQDVTGTVDKVSGTTNLNVQLSSRTYLTANASSPCPKCVSGACNAGANPGGACTPQGSQLTSIDCPPQPGQFVAALPIALNPLRTSPDVVTTSSSGNFCPNQANAGAFGRPTTRCIVQQGLPPGDLTAHTAKAGRLGCNFCIPATSNTVLNGKTNIPGPGSVSIVGTFQLQ